MSNEQPITKQHLADTDHLQLVETFYSIQGEGPWQGLPCLFIRLAGCNLRCTWCDTNYTEDVYPRTVQSIYERVSASKAKRVVITGGEPFVQNIAPLVHKLYDNGYPVQIETNGTLSIPHFPWNKVTIVCSPKAGKLHKDIKQHCNDFKYVLGGDDLTIHPLPYDNGLPAIPTQKGGKKPPEHMRNTQDITVWVMPRDDDDIARNEYNRDATVMSALTHGHRLCMQLHKILGVR